MKIKLFFLFLCLFSITLSAQSNKIAIDKQLEEAAYHFEVDNNAEKGLKILSQAKEASKRIGYKEGILKCEKILMFFYSSGGNYKKVIETSHEMEPLAMELKNNSAISDLHRLRALSLGELGLNDQSYKEFQDAFKYAKKIEKENIQHYKTALICENMTSYFDHIKSSQDSILYYLKKSLLEAQKIEDNDPDVKLNYKYSSIANTNSNLGLFYMDICKPQNMELAEKYFLDALEVYNNKKYGMVGAEKVSLLAAVGRFYSTRKDYTRAIQYATDAIKLEKKINSPYNLKDSYEILAKSYLELNNKELSKKYTELYASLNDSLSTAEKISIKTPLNYIISEKDKNSRDTISKVLITAGCIIIILVVLGWLFWKRQNKKLREKYEKVIEHIAKKSEVVAHADTANIIEKFTEKPLNIKDETISTLLLKLEKFEKSKNFIKKEVSLAYLANHLNTNTKSLSKIIRQYKESSFNDYINKLRIKYIVELLYDEPKNREYKISYLAELCGFSSREVFTTIFKKETGISPSYFIDNLKKDIDINSNEVKQYQE